MKKLYTYILVLLAFATNELKAQEYLYEEAYNALNEMIQDSSKYSFKNAVFAVENAYKDGLLDTIYINEKIKSLKFATQQIQANNKLKDYSYRDKHSVAQYASLYTLMTDTLNVFYEGKEYKRLPYRYDFDDIWGDDSWENMFVSKLLDTKKGNCHSLPYLYKILAEELGIDAHLALSPNHVYIKHRNLKDGWYNTELTSGYFPNDGWIMASGYIHLDAVRNGMFMKAMDNKESIALVLIDLAQGYQKKFPINDGSFILKCCETALKYYPVMANALLLKLETYKKKIEVIAESKNKQFNEVLNTSEAKPLWISINQQVQYIADLGYRQMPKEMYLDWLVSLKEEKEKYINKKITTFKNKN